jgi:hypothetical protein
VAWARSSTGLRHWIGHPRRSLALGLGHSPGQAHLLVLLHRRSASGSQCWSVCRLADRFQERGNNYGSVGTASTLHRAFEAFDHIALGLLLRARIRCPSTPACASCGWVQAHRYSEASAPWVAACAARRSMRSRLVMAIVTVPSRQRRLSVQARQPSTRCERCFVASEPRAR